MTIDWRATRSVHILIFISSSRCRSEERPCPTSTRLLATVSESGLDKLLQEVQLLYDEAKAFEQTHLRTD